MTMIKKQVNIAKRDPPKCVVCESTDAVFVATYRDPAVEYPSHTFTKGPMAGRQWCSFPTVYACIEHVAEATAILLKREGLIK